MGQTSLSGIQGSHALPWPTYLVFPIKCPYTQGHSIDSTLKDCLATCVDPALQSLNASPSVRSSFWNIPWALQLHSHLISLECLQSPFVYPALIVFKRLLNLLIFDHVFPGHLGQKQFPSFQHSDKIYFEPYICCLILFWIVQCLISFSRFL